MTTTPNSQAGAPLGAAGAANLTDADDEVNRDAALDDAARDSDGVPVGSADAEADAQNSGADRG